MPNLESRSLRGVYAAAGASEATGAIRIWLGLVAVLVFVMVSVGGATRLTDSGLSITEWQPIMGAIPPLSEADWQAVFAKYKQIPEYHLVNRGMSLDEFRVIFWWEWSHRFLGRVIGLAFALPLAWFWWQGQLAGRLGRRLVALLGLGALQGFVGWYMVQSGLVDRVDVSQYRLALHLTLAIVILGALVWIILGLEEPSWDKAGKIGTGQRRLAYALFGLVLVQIVAGALVAGTKAGHIFNTWPLMDGALIPSGLFADDPWWLAAFEHRLTVQFNHRVLAYLIAALALWHAIASARRPGAQPVAHTAGLLAAGILAQAALGIWTLLSVVPIPLGLAHQSGAAALFCLTVWHLKRVSRARASA